MPIPNFSPLLQLHLFCNLQIITTTTTIITEFPFSKEHYLNKNNRKMSSNVLSSQSVIITTAMAVSGAVILLSLCRIKNLPIIHSSNHHASNSSSLRSCLAHERLKGENKNKKKKRVKFADNVKEERSDAKKKNEGELVKVKKVKKFREMPANRAALYHGILRDRLQRVESF